MLKNCYKHRELIWNLVLKELKLRYRGSFLGFFWTLLDPLFMILILLFVFTKLFRYDLPNYPSFLLIGIFIWNYFQEATLKGLHIFKDYRDIITKTHIPKEVLIIGVNLISLIDFLLKFIILIISLFILKIVLTWPSLIHINLNFLILIFIISLQALFILGITFILSTTYIYFKDLINIWGVLMHVGFFVTPIFYPKNLIPIEYHFVFTMNPMYHFIEAYRNIIIDGLYPKVDNFLPLILFTFLTIVIGLFIFKKLKKNIAENV